MNLLLRLVLYLTIGFVVICVYLYFMQSRLVYIGATAKFTAEEARQKALAVGLVPWKPEEVGGYRGFVSPDFGGPAPRGTFVVVHGNGEVSWQRKGETDTFRKRGFRTLLYEYPGYGGRTGVPSELTIVPDLRGVIRELEQNGFGPVYLWGQSLGSGVAAAACADATVPVQGLALVTPYDALPNVAASYYPLLPVKWLMIDRYNTIKNLQHFAHPVCLMRSDHDEVIPPPLSLNLWEHLTEPKKMIVFKNAGHNDWPGETPDTYLDEAIDFVAPRT